MDRLRKEAKVPSVKRTVSSLTLDGKRLMAEIDIEFVRDLGLNTAEAIGDQVFAITDAILGEQIVQSRVHLKAAELEDLIHARLGATSGKVEQVRVHRLRVAATSAPASHVQGTSHGKATPPPLPQARAVPPPLPAAYTRPTPSPTSAPGSGERRIAQGPASSRAPQDALRQSTAPPAKPRPSSRPASRASSRPGTRRSAHPPPLPPASSKPQRPTLPAGTEPEKAEPSRTAEQVGPFAGRLIRDAAAYSLITVLGSAPATVDKWEIFEGKGAARALRQEAAACFAAAVYMAARGAGATHEDAVGFVNAASRSAALTDVPAPADVGRYISSEHPSDALSARMAELVGGGTESSLFTQALATCHKTVASRLREALGGSR